MVDANEFDGRLERYLQTVYPQRQALRVTGVQRLTGGFSYETYFVSLGWQAQGDGHSQVLVLSKEPEHGVAPPYDVRPQFEVLQRLQGTGIPVPGVVALESEGTVLGRRFFIMEKVAGQNLDTYITQYPEHLEALRQQYAQIIVRLHQANWQSLELTHLKPPVGAKGHAMAEIARYEAIMLANQYTPQPLMAHIFTWLKKNAPVAERSTLCHGDLKVGVAGNFFADQGRITALLDWELVNIGDPLSDLGYVSLVLQNRLFWDSASFIDTYEAMSGTRVDPQALFFWEVMTYVKWIVMGYPGFRSGLVGEVADVRSLTANVAYLPWLKNEAAKKLGI